MSSPISSAFKSTTHRQVLTDDAPAPFYLFPESIRSKGNSAKFDQDAFVFQYWPETLESNYNVEYGQRSVFGGTHPLFQYTGGTGRDITFTARFSAEVRDVYRDGGGLQITSPSYRYSVDCRAAVDYIQSLMLPTYGGGGGNVNALLSPPQRMYLVMEGTRLGGGAKDEVLCILRSAPVTYEAWFPDGSPRLIELSLTFSECVQHSSGENSRIQWHDRAALGNPVRRYGYRGTVDQAKG